MNVLKDFPLTKGYYMRHPLTFFRHAVINLKHAKQRIVRGYADCDSFDMAHFLLDILPEILPLYGEDTKDIIDGLNELKEEKKNEWEDEFESHAIVIADDGVLYTTLTDEIMDAWLDRQLEISEERKEKAKEVFALLGEKIFSLWL